MPKLFGGGQPALKLANPIAADMSDMRPSLIPGLAAAAERNARRGFGDVALFEVGQVFFGAGEGDQRIAAAALRRGLAKRQGEGRHWSGGGAADVFDAKGDALALLAALGVPQGAVQIVPGGPAFLHPGRSATLQFGPKTVVGWFGQLHPSACEALDAEGPLVGFEILLDPIPPPKARPTKAKPKLDRSEYMAVARDLAFVTPEATRAADIVKAALGADRALLTDAQVFDVYRGPGLPEGSKSVAVAVTLQPRERTLTDAEIDGVVAKIVAEVAKKTGATLEGMKLLLVIALLAAAPAPAAAQDCSRYADPLAYNACLASGGPAARKVHVGAAPARRPAARAVSRRGRSRMVFSVRK